MSRKVIITCAVTGNSPVHPKYPYEYPETPAQIAAAVVEAASAGAAVCHIHARDITTRMGSRAPYLYREIVDRIRIAGVDVVINLTCGGGALLLPDPDDESRALPASDVANVEDRVEYIRDCLPEIASLDVTTANQSEGSFEYVYLNTTRTLRGMARKFQEFGVKPELEVFGPGDIEFGKQLIAEGLVDAPPLFQLVLGVKWCAPATPETMLYMRNLLPPQARWASFGIARMQMPMVAQAVLLGGNVRVGLEDNLYLSRGRFATNAQLVESARRIIENLGEEVATVAEARTILDLKQH